MSLFKKIFGGKDIGFELLNGILKNPTKWNTIALKEVFGSLTKPDVKLIEDVLNVMRSNLKHHFDFWVNDDFNKDLLKIDPSKLCKSYFELLMVEFSFIASLFNRNTIKEEIGEAIYCIIFDSIQLSSNKASINTSFENLQVFMEGRINLYSDILDEYFDDKIENVTGVSSRSLYKLIILDPLTTDVENLKTETSLDLVTKGLIKFDMLAHLRDSLLFDLNFYKGSSIFMNSLQKTIDKYYKSNLLTKN